MDLYINILFKSRSMRHSMTEKRCSGGNQTKTKITVYEVICRREVSISNKGSKGLTKDLSCDGLLCMK